MYNIHALQPTLSNKIFAAGIKYYELIKLAIKPSVYKDNHSKEYFPFILNAVVKGYTVLDVGSHQRNYLSDMFKISKLPGKLVAFETTTATYSYLTQMKQLMNFDNICIEQLEISEVLQELPEANNTSGGTVIDFNARVNIENRTVPGRGKIDDYCLKNFAIPALIKFKLELNNIDVLFSATQLLQKYKPQVLLECVEGKVSRDTLIKTFEFLTDLHYSGSFILDTIKVPLASFDFNIYQNEVLGFYCTNFIFE